MFPNYLNHTSARALVTGYHSSANRAVALQKPFVMLETGTGSCGGFPGVSDSFGAAIWGVDYALQMAGANFSHALMHIGGQSVYYNVSFVAFQLAFLDLTRSIGIHTPAFQPDIIP